MRFQQPNCRAKIDITAPCPALRAATNVPIHTDGRLHVYRSRQARHCMGCIDILLVSHEAIQRRRVLLLSYIHVPCHAFLFVPCSFSIPVLALLAVAMILSIEQAMKRYGILSLRGKDMAGLASNLYLVLVPSLKSVV